MTNRTILITGACGEIGHALVDQLTQNGDTLVTLDLRDIQDTLSSKVTHITGSIADSDLIDQVAADYTFDIIFHLAALLSTSAEQRPGVAHEVNVNATQRLLEMADAHTQRLGRPVRFLFPSSIAAHGLPDLATKAAHPRLTEDQFLTPETMYGVNKLYVEHLGRYFSTKYDQLNDPDRLRIDFRSLRFPGLISAHTVPSGGTSDFGPEMLHAAAQGQPYESFVRADTAIPFMAMPDGVKALLGLAEAPKENLTRTVYNVTSFSLSAEEFYSKAMAFFPEAEVSYDIHPQRQGIVDSWPVDTDDSAARADWGWQPDYDLDRCFAEYLAPNITARYQTAAA